MNVQTYDEVSLLTHENDGIFVPEDVASDPLVDANGSIKKKTQIISNSASSLTRYEVEYKIVWPEFIRNLKVCGCNLIV